MAEDGPPSGENLRDDEHESNDENPDQPQHLHLDLGDELSRKLEINRMNSGPSGELKQPPILLYI